MGNMLGLGPRGGIRNGRESPSEILIRLGSLADSTSYAPKPCRPSASASGLRPAVCSLSRPKACSQLEEAAPE
jgi:hypothetical protein